MARDEMKECAVSQYEDDDDEFDDDEADESALVKDLRKQLRAANKKASDLETQVNEFGKGLRERTVKDVLTAKGVRSGVAKFIPSDVNDEAGINAWLEENAEDLGITLGEPDSGDEEPDPALEEARKAQSLSQRAAKPTTMAEFQKRLETATDDEWEQVLLEAKKAGVGY